MLDIITGFLSGILTSMGFGGGTILIIYLTVFLNYNQTRAAGINLLYYIPCAIISVVIFIQNKIIAGKDVLFIFSGAIIGAIIGAFLANYIDQNIIKKIFSLYAIGIGIYSLFK